MGTQDCPIPEFNSRVAAAIKLIFRLNFERKDIRSNINIAEIIVVT